MKSQIDWKAFAGIYNDLSGYPKLADVAEELGIGLRTVRDRAGKYQAQRRRNKKLPKLISRIRKKAEATPSDHAKVRARTLAGEITGLLTSTKYPVINPEAVLVESYMSRRYNRKTKDYELQEGVPRTWLTDTLIVKPIMRHRRRRFIFTGAQNDAPVHQGFWENLKVYADYIGAEIVVGPWTYETQWWSENNPTSRSYAGELGRHLCFGEMSIGSDLMFCGQMNTLPTATRPISDLMNYSRNRWAIFPHSKQALLSVPTTDPHVQAKQIMTTGACTVPKVIARKAGLKSIFHHVIGAVIVEIDGDGDIFSRHLHADVNGAFYDFDVRVSAGKITRGHRVKGITWADIHRAKMQRANAIAAFGYDPRERKIVTKNNMLDQLRPEYCFYHDTFDNESRNAHHIGDNAYSYEMAYRGRDSVMFEVLDAANFLWRTIRPDTKSFVIASNHDLGLEKYVRSGRYRNDGINVRYGMQLEDAYLEYRERVAHALDSGQRPPTFDLFEHAARLALGKSLDPVRWVHDGQSFFLDDVQVGHHGFRGSNGSLGSITGFARLGVRMSIADKHAPAKLDGLCVAGAMELHHGYNKGPSSWAVSHILQYQDGHRTIVTMQNGKYRGSW